MSLAVFYWKVMGWFQIKRKWISGLLISRAFWFAVKVMWDILLSVIKKEYAISLLYNAAIDYFVRMLKFDINSPLWYLDKLILCTAVIYCVQLKKVRVIYLVALGLIYCLTGEWWVEAFIGLLWGMKIAKESLQLSAGKRQLCGIVCVVMLFSYLLICYKGWNVSRSIRYGFNLFVAMTVGYLAITYNGNARILKVLGSRQIRKMATTIYFVHASIAVACSRYAVKAFIHISKGQYSDNVKDCLYMATGIFLSVILSWLFINCSQALRKKLMQTNKPFV